MEVLICNGNLFREFVPIKIGNLRRVLVFIWVQIWIEQI